MDSGQHTGTSILPAKKASNSFLDTSNNDRCIIPKLIGKKTEHGITVYNPDILGGLFKDRAISWLDRVCPRIFKIQAITMQDATVFKFTMQHAAGDAVGTYLAIGG
jgi:hypothetical protein